MPTAICFIEKSRSQRRLSPTSAEWEIGNWNVAEPKARSLIGQRIYFLETQAGDSYFGGKITDIRVLAQSTEEWSGRIVFEFIPDSQGKGYKAGPANWGNEQKTIP